jgi:hypothetical protein
VSHQCPKTRSDQPDEAIQTRHAKRPEHYSCDTVEQQFTHLSSLGVKWSQVQILSARQVSARQGSTQVRSGFENLGSPVVGKKWLRTPKRVRQPALGAPLLIFVAVPRTVRLRRTRLAGSDRSTRWRKRIPPKPVITTWDRPNSRITMTQRSKVVASDGDVATSSAPWSEGRNWLHQPKRITADHWSYLRLWADCGHGVGTDRQRANPNLLLGEHLTVVVPQGI